MATRAEDAIVRVPSAIERRRLTVQGIVQGVGFRPFVYGLATRLGLVGFVRNDSAGVIIEVEGDSHTLTAFQRALHTDAPPLAWVDGSTVQSVPARNDTSFRITKSRDASARRTLVSPDVATCTDCLRELFDTTDRRFRYPFINCTNCGPRFTIVQDVPYDPANTARTNPSR